VQRARHAWRERDQRDAAHADRARTRAAREPHVVTADAFFGNLDDAGGLTLRSFKVAP
jgi:hypothetical protein